MCLTAALCMKILTHGTETQTIGDFTYELNSNTHTATITEYVGGGGNVIIEGAEYEGKKYTVTTIDTGAFKNNEAITSVTGNSIYEILDASTLTYGAFRDCKNLKTATFSNAIHIGDETFIRCTALTSVNLPKAISIAQHAFEDCTALKTAILPQGDFVYELDVENSTAKVIEYKGNITYITIPTTVKFTGDVIGKIYNVTVDGSGFGIEVEGGTEYTYNNEEWNPEFKFKDNKNNYYNLVKGTDYTVEFPKDMTNAGEKTVKIQYIGNYTGSSTINLTIAIKNDSQNYKGTKEITLTINKKNISELTVELEGGTEHTYDGNEWKPVITVKDGETLVTSDEYTVEFPGDMTNVGTKNIKINYIGNYTGGKDIQLEIVVDKSDWGEKINNNGVVNYVDEFGKTSAEVTGNEMIWLKEASDSTSAWYAIDNTNGVFKKGSRFWVKWLSAENDKEEFEKYYNKLDDEHKKKVENNKLWIFLTGVTDPDGNDYTNLDGSVDYYVQLGEDWDKEDIKAVFISDKSDDVLEVTYENLKTPARDYEVARLSMRHFSPYAVFDSADEVIPIASDEKKDKNENTNENNFIIRPTKENFEKIINSGLIAKISILIVLILISSAIIFNKSVLKSKRNKN